MSYFPHKNCGPFFPVASSPLDWILFREFLEPQRYSDKGSSPMFPGLLTIIDQSVDSREYRLRSSDTYQRGKLGGRCFL